MNNHAIEVLKVLAAIADAYDANNLDPPARRFWGANLEHELTTAPDEIELYAGRGGRTLLTLADCMRARNVIALAEGGGQ